MWEGSVFLFRRAYVNWLLPTNLSKLGHLGKALCIAFRNA